MAATDTIKALPATVGLELYAGDDFTFTLTLSNADETAADLGGAVAEAQIRATADADPPVASFAPVITGNVIALTLSGTDSAALPSKAVWDCQITDRAGLVTTVAAGTIAMTSEITRS